MTPEELRRCCPWLPRAVEFYGLDPAEAAVLAQRAVKSANDRYVRIAGRFFEVRL